MLIDFTYPSVFQRDFYGNRTKWSSVRSVIIRVLQPLPTAKQESDLFNHEYDYRLNWTEFLLPINYNHYNFRENMIFLCNCPIADNCPLTTANCPITSMHND